MQWLQRWLQLLWLCFGFLLGQRFMLLMFEEIRRMHDLYLKLMHLMRKRILRFAWWMQEVLWEHRMYVWYVHQQWLLGMWARLLQKRGYLLPLQIYLARLYRMCDSIYLHQMWVTLSRRWRIRQVQMQWEFRIHDHQLTGVLHMRIRVLADRARLRIMRRDHSWVL